MLLVVEYHLINEGGLLNVMGSAFRVIVDGSTEGPIDTISVGMMGAGIVNDALVFSFPPNASSFTLEAGPPAVVGAGLTSVYDITLEADPGALDHIVAQESVGDAAIEAAGSAELSSGDGLIDVNPGNPAQGEGLLEIVNVSTTQRHDGRGSGKWEKFVYVDWRLTVAGSVSNLLVEFIRIEAGGELYMAVDGPIEIAQPGQILEGRSVFKLPRDVSEFTIDAGPLESRGDGFRAQFEAKLG